MGIDDSLIEDLLVGLAYINDSQIDKVRQQAVETGRGWHEIVLDEGLVSEADLLKATAKKLGVGWTSLPSAEVDLKAVRQISRRLAELYQLVVFGTDGSSWRVAMANPRDIEALDLLQHHQPGQHKIYLTNQAAILKVLDKAEAKLKPAPARSDLSRLSAPKSRPPIEQILSQALAKQASDIHLEPLDNHLLIRFRINGLLKVASKLPLQLLAGLNSDLKRLAGLDVKLNHVAQHGYFGLAVDGQHCLFQVSLVPTLAGEKAAIKIMPQAKDLPSLKGLGFLTKSRQRLTDGLAEAGGLILVGGPSRAGKTTSLYSYLKLLEKGNLNIGTIEEPVKRRLSGIHQLQVNHQTGLDLVGGIQALMHQDLDVLMISSLPSRQVAELAVQAAGTGKLVLAGCHAQSAVASIRQLLDMGLPGYLLASNLRLVVNQRLVRTLVKPKAYQPSQKQLNQIAAELDLATPAKSYWTGLEKLAGQLSQDLDLSLSSSFSFYKPESDQLAAYGASLNLNEVLTIDAQLRAAIGAEADRSSLEKLAGAADFVPLAQDGLAKARLGLTSVEEVLRVV